MTLSSVHLHLFAGGHLSVEPRLFVGSFDFVAVQERHLRQSDGDAVVPILRRRRRLFEDFSHSSRHGETYRQVSSASMKLIGGRELTRDYYC